MDLTAAEQDIMKCIWDKNEPLAIAEMNEILTNKFNRKWSYKTVASFLLILERKGFVEHFKKGRCFYYQAIPAEEDFKRQQMEKIKDFWYEGSLEEMVAACVGTKNMTKEDQESLMKLLVKYDD